MTHTISRRRKRKRAATRISETAGATSDAVENERHNTTNMIWDVSGYSGLRGEQKLMDELKDAMFHVKQNNKARFTSLHEHVVASGIGNLVGMRYNTFNEWMSGQHGDEKRIKDWNKAAMLSYIGKYDYD
mmetsp:Transcript_29859/g.63338  ORF Transcript_29859/g.63338 Transcript_29859/m.63338 type:complete len:130 (-) Transcript_29859:18-407(-)